MIVPHIVKQNNSTTKIIFSLLVLNVTDALGADMRMIRAAQNSHLGDFVYLHCNLLFWHSAEDY